MKYSVMINAGPDEAAAGTALAFTRALIARGHEVKALFFYRRGVHLASTLVAEPEDNPARAWQALVRDENLPASVCVGAAARRGVVDAAEAGRRALPADNLARGFALTGLGEWVEASAASDRVLVFGA